MEGFCHQCANTLLEAISEGEEIIRYRGRHLCEHCFFKSLLEDGTIPCSSCATLFNSADTLKVVPTTEATLTYPHLRILCEKCLEEYKALNKLKL